MPKTSSKASNKGSRKSKSNGGDDDSSKDKRFQISNNRFVSVGEFRGRLRVDIREFWTNDEGKKLPGKKGISLSLEEWTKLKDLVDDVDAAVKKMDSDASESESEDD